MAPYADDRAGADPFRSPSRLALPVAVLARALREDADVPGDAVAVLGQEADRIVAAAAFVGGGPGSALREGRAALLEADLVQVCERLREALAVTQELVERLGAEEQDELLELGRWFASGAA